MSLRRLFQRIRKRDAHKSSLENDRLGTPSNATMAPAHTLPGSDSVRLPDEDTLGSLEVTTPDYVYYRIYAEDGALPSTTPVAPGNPFLGRIKIRSVPPPRTVETVKSSIAKVENIKDRESTALYLTPYSQSPMDDTEKVTILNGTGPGSTPQEPLALVAKMTDSERRALESRGRGGLASSSKPSSTSPEIRYVYYLLYGDDYEIPSKVAFIPKPEEPSLGRIRADFVPPPHSPTTIKRCISRVEGNPALVNSDLYSDITCDTPLTEGQIPIFRTDGPGLSPDEPMAIVQVKTASSPDGRYVIKNRAANIYWSVYDNHITTVYFSPETMEEAKKYSFMQWDITQDTDGNISITSPFVPSSWVGAELKGSSVPVPWRLISADSKSYYITTDMNRVSLNPLVPASPGVDYYGPGTMATLKEGDQFQMWEFIRIKN